MKFSVEDDIELSEEALECVGGGFGIDFDSSVSTLIVPDDEYQKWQGTIFFDNGGGDLYNGRAEIKYIQKRIHGAHLITGGAD